ncbi:MAG: T9SS type A sorting domain-containing protein [Bacteroidales bacterium]|nr:T9SS type A sorting domain-containing protein [Bacteroidales bacterium]
MKKLHYVLASFLMLIALNVSAQNQRVLLFECFTNTGCGPCASQNPALDALINANGDRIAAIKYHVSWPGPGDPMYLHNPSESNSRVSYYGVQAVPHTVVDGNRYANVPSGLTQNKVNEWLAIESPLEMTMTHRLNAAQDTITVFVMAKANAPVSGNLKLMVGVIEKEIHYTSAPGSNGERDFYSVMKKLLPSASGTNIENMSEGDVITYAFKWKLENVYHNEQLSAIAWIQDFSTKAVFQACKSDENATFYNNDAMMSEISNIKTMVCSGVSEPKVVLTNFGKNIITSADFEVRVNGEVVKTATWEGSLASLASTTVSIGEIEYPVEGSNVVDIIVTSVNGGEDENHGNDTATLSFSGSPANTGATIKLVLRTDANPQETTWEVTNISTGEVVLSGGPYSEPNKLHNETLVMPSGGCYDFTIYDTGGDGLTDGSGLYGVKAGNTTLFSGREFTYSESNEFTFDGPTGVEENQTLSSIYPNPTSGIINIVEAGENTVSIFTMTGQRVYQTVISESAKIDMSEFGKGVYVIKIGDKVQRVVVE